MNRSSDDSVNSSSEANSPDHQKPSSLLPTITRHPPWTQSELAPQAGEISQCPHSLSKVFPYYSTTYAVRFGQLLMCSKAFSVPSCPTLKCKPIHHRLLVCYLLRLLFFTRQHLILDFRHLLHVTHLLMFNPLPDSWS